MDINNIDWSKAPEGTTHFFPASRGYKECWGMITGNKLAIIPTENVNFPSWSVAVSRAGRSDPIPRPVEGGGEGLPPVGAVCYGSVNHIWQQCKVLYHHIGGAAAVLIEGQEDRLAWATRFKPLETKREIAVEEFTRTLVMEGRVMMSPATAEALAEAALTWAESRGLKL